MKPYHLTVDELCRHGEITYEWVAEAVKAYLAGNYAIPHPLSAEYALNLAYAVLSHPFAAAMVRDDRMDALTRAAAVRTAFLMAQPVRREGIND